MFEIIIIIVISGTFFYCIYKMCIENLYNDWDHDYLNQQQQSINTNEYLTDSTNQLPLYENVIRDSCPSYRAN